MRNLFIKLFSLLLVLVSLLTLTACGGNEGHQHAFEKKYVIRAYLASKATCTVPAKYYYACECGEKSDATYDLGYPLHDYVDHVCRYCKDEEEYTEGLAINPKNGYLIGFKAGATIPTGTVIVPTKIDNVPARAVGASAFKGATFKQIVLPEGVELIGLSAFENSKLVSITIPSTVMQIQIKAFANSNVVSVDFLVTEGWYAGRHVMPEVSEEFVVDASIIENELYMARSLSRATNQYHGGNNNFYRVSK